MGRPILRTVPEKILTPLAHPVDGHLRVRLFSGDGIATSVRRQVHHLVLCAFVCERPSGMVGCHNDDNPANNTLENLRWDTPAANVADAIRSGNHASARWIREKQKRTEARRRASA